MAFGATACGGGDNGDEGLPSLAEARKATQEHPDKPDGWRDLSTVLQLKRDEDGAVSALNRYLTLKPKDVLARRELGGLYFAQARNRRDNPKRASTAPAAFKNAIAT